MGSRLAGGQSGGMGRERLQKLMALAGFCSRRRGEELLRQGHTYLDSNGDGEACESLRH